MFLEVKVHQTSIWKVEATGGDSKCHERAEACSSTKRCSEKQPNALRNPYSILVLLVQHDGPVFLLTAS